MLGLLLSLILINVMSHYGFKLYLSILAGIIVVAAFNSFTIAKSFTLFFVSATSPVTVTLAFIVIAMTAFGNILRETGGMKIMVEKLSLIVKDRRHQIVLLPALISLLAFPGGAVFSAPLVEEAGSGIGLDKTKLALVNIMFRHLVYLIFPFYSGLILLSELSGISVFYFIRLNLLLFILFIGLMYIILFRGLDIKKEGRFEVKELPALFWSLSPLLLTIILAAIFNVYFPLAILFGISLALFHYLPNDQPLGVTIKKRASCLWYGINWPMTLSIVFILVLKDFLEASGVINNISSIMVARNVPWLVIAVVIPYLIGFITGSQTASVAMSAPLLLSAVPFPEIRSYLFLIFITSLAGYLGSPLHLCAVATAEHFGVPLQQLVRKVNYFSALLVLAGIGFFFTFTLLS
ncbi:MAG: DUF401 family protein [Clostridiales bacterium]|nr:DUF401 family protein [Clostridiales bacterium]